MSEYDDTIDEDIGGSMVDQLGSSAKHLSRGDPDYEIISIIRDSEDNPDLFFPSVWMNAVADIMSNGSNFISAWGRAAQKGSIAVRGGGRSGIIKAEQVKKSGSVIYESEVQEPSRMDRILRRKNVDEYERQERDRLEI